MCASRSPHGAYIISRFSREPGRLPSAEGGPAHRSASMEVPKHGFCRGGFEKHTGHVGMASYLASALMSDAAYFQTCLCLRV